MTASRSHIVSSERKMASHARDVEAAAKGKVFPLTDSTYKICTGCDESKPLSGYHKRRGGYSGHVARCRECIREARRKHYLENKDRLLAESAERRAQNKDRYQPALDRWRAKNKPRLAELQRKWRRDNPKKYRMWKRGRQAVGRGAVFVEHVDEDVLWLRDGGVCGICGEKVPRIEDSEMDHIVPAIKGGEHSYSNTRLVHPRCNRSKGAKTT